MEKPIGLIGGALKLPGHMLVYEKITGHLLGLMQYTPQIEQQDKLYIAIPPKMEIGISSQTFTTTPCDFCVIADIEQLRLSSGQPVGDKALFMTYEDWIKIKCPVWHPNAKSFFKDI